MRHDRYATGEAPRVGDLVAPADVKTVGEVWTVRDITWLATEFAVTDHDPPGVVQTLCVLDQGQRSAALLQLVRRAES